MKKTPLVALSLASLLSFAVSSCSSGGPVKSQAYAKLANKRTFEYEFPIVWQGIEKTLASMAIDKRDPADVNDIELRQLRRRRIETAWIYSQSRDKYQEYRVNGFPKKVYLQTRVKYVFDAESQMGGTTVTVRPQEEIERLRDDGSSSGYSSAEIDTSRTNELLDRIGNAILSSNGDASRSNSAD